MASSNVTADLLKQAIAYHQQGQLDQAHSIYQQILRVDPEQPDTLHLLGVIAHQRGDHTRAIDHIKRALIYKTTDATIFSNLGEVYRALKEYENAIESYDQAIKLDPDYHPAWNNMGAALYELNRIDESIDASR